MDLKNKLYDHTDCISEETMYKYIDKKLSAKEEHLVEKHLIDCELCSDAIEGLRLTKNRNRINEINSAISEQLSPGKRRSDIRLIISVAAGLLLLVGGVFLFNQFVSYNKENTVALKTVPVEEKKVITIPQSESNEQSPDNSVETYKSFNPEKKDLPQKSDEDLKETVTIIQLDEVREETKFSELSDAKDELANLEKDDNKPDQDLENTPTVSSNSVSSGSTAMEPLLKKQEEGLNDKSEKAKEQVQMTSEKGTSKKNKYRSKSDAKKVTDSEVTTSAPPAAAESKNELADLAQTTDQSKNINDSLISFSGETEKIYSVVDEMPVYPGGQEALLKYFRQNLHLPVSGNDNNLATIVIQFIVDSKGKASKAKLIKPENKEFEKQIIDLVNKMPQWTPGKLSGREVNVFINLPVKVHIE